ncbi:MAG: colanic acid biosynthesis acetyltransferase WcaF [Sphingobacteriales bacterium]|nr:MAG: colanic acid biosynthesis acetyltransferase WcaF [Sphingobacteriales bacterium]
MIYPTTQLKKKFDKKDFRVGASSAKVYSWYIISTLFFHTGLIPFSSLLVLILRLFGANIGRNVRIKPGIRIKYPWKLSVDDHSWLAACHIENLDEVTIGKNVCVSQQAMLLTGSHNYKIPSFDLITKPIVLYNGAWIGAKAVVCPGVTVATHAVLTVGSVATKNMLPYMIYQGNPAIQIRKRTLL